MSQQRITDAQHKLREFVNALEKLDDKELEELSHRVNDMAIAANAIGDMVFEYVHHALKIASR